MTERSAEPPAGDLAPLLELLAETTTLTLATLDPDGTPRATPLYFAPDAQADLVFLSDPETPHAQNLANSPRAAVGAYPEAAHWREIRGVQMKGVVERLAGNEAERALALYRSRFTFVDEVPAALEGMSAYIFRPAWARLIDNRHGFGFRREWRFS